MHQHYRNSPARYFTHLIGHEGENSLLSLLIDEGLAEALYADTEDLMDLISLLEINITLTKKGLEQYLNVINLVFEYISMLKREGI
jgi:insulysin